ncbi:calcium uniporter protein 4, mitochondrial-like [Cucurbita pepo subsp. pepo]|uniref:calcium uniporter protein 4, mitochondrial-like n=1 Tax=Cucurbita pepo subsp. pepo TaxID=3664 RepID=UPI000C9D7FBB|nr:calcium uniporter protein 4, mitochondrial-like [Cucurbita pepo subsp. pepo]
MAFRRPLCKRFLDAYRTNPFSPSLCFSLRRDYLSPPMDSAVKAVFRRLLHRRAIYHSPSTPPISELLSTSVGNKLREKIGGSNITGDRIRLDGLIPPASLENECSVSGCGISIDDARKIIRLSQVEKLKAKLRDIPRSSISYSEFTRICIDDCGNKDDGAEFAKLLDKSGSVIVLGNIVFLRPDQVAKSMETMISRSIATPDDPRFKQLSEMEKQKAAIDKKAKAQVQAELFCGLGLVMGQTLGFMRLTFWELSWDVMEPICFFATSLYFTLGYGFFLSTSTEPTFEGVFRRRFKAKQTKLMASHNFDIDNYNELRRICYPNHRGGLS